MSLNAQYDASPVTSIHLEHAFDIALLLRDAIELDNDGELEVDVAPKREASPPFKHIEAPAIAPKVRENFTAAVNENVTGSLNTRTQKNKLRAAKYKKKKKDFEITHGLPLPPTIALRHIANASHIETQLKVDTLPASTCGYQAKTSNSSKRVTLRLDQLLKEGYRLERWDGKCTKVFEDTTTHKIFSVAVESPLDDAGYVAAVNDAYQAMYSVGQRGNFAEKEVSHRRGEFPVYNIGVSYGGGPQEPHNMNIPQRHHGLVDELLDNPGLIRLANFGSRAFQTWAPDVYEYYRVRTQDLFNRMPHLKRNFQRSVFACCAFNLGPQVTTYLHRDCLNCPFGWCEIQALGQFDPTTGGHFILEQLKLIIEFPSGALFLVPSATVTHGNTPVQPGETRLSFTQFTAGSIFRFIDNGYRTEKAFKKEDEVGYQRMLEAKELRWEFGMGLWSTLDELKARAQFML